MADLIIAVVFMLGAGSAAEGVRTMCRRQLLRPVPSRGITTAARDLELSR